MVSTGDWLEAAYLVRLARRVAIQHGLGTEDCADLLQEVRIALWEQGLATPVSAAWVIRVASRKAVDQLRRRARTRSRESSFASQAAGAAHDSEFDHLLRARAAALPEKLKKFYDLHYVQGWSEREIAAAMGICRASVRWLDRCCRRRLGGDNRPPAPSSGWAFRSAGARREGRTP
jgi:RNA polymerase sigma factor (sigma-70 family)